MANYITKDSGKRQDFETGSRRDTNEGKVRPGLIGPELKRRLGELMARGAEKYTENNWRLGQKASRYHDSLERHLLQWQEGDDTEDHLAAIVFNVMGLMHLEKHMPEHLDHERYTLMKQHEQAVAQTNITVEMNTNVNDIVQEIKRRREAAEPVQVTGLSSLPVVVQENEHLTNTQKVNAGLRVYCVRCNHWHDVDADWCEGLRTVAPTQRYPDDL